MPVKYASGWEICFCIHQPTNNGNVSQKWGELHWVKKVFALQNMGKNLVLLKVGAKNELKIKQRLTVQLTDNESVK